MEDDLASRLTRVEQEIKSLKTNQKMQNDSYTLYTYTTGNLAFKETTSGPSIKDYVISFIPSRHSQDEVVCQFYVFDASQVNALYWGSVDVNYPQTCKFSVYCYPDISSFPDWQKKVYALCVANCEGELKISYTSS